MQTDSIYQKEVTFKMLLAFTVPTILMTLIQASYSMIDGIFIANILGNQALSSLTLISPYFSLFMAIATMFASGGSAIVMKKMGEKKELEGKQDFTMLILANIIIGSILTAVTILCSEDLVSVFKTTAEVSANSNEYLFAYSFFIIPQLLFCNLQVYTIASGNAKLAMASSIFGGIFNIAFDYILIKFCALGMAGAAIASGFGMLIPCLILSTQFAGSKNMLHFVRPKFRPQVLLKTMTNGFSEFSSNLVSGVVMMLFNARMLTIAGENGVAASTITFYVFGLMSALYMGYMFGVSPLLSYFYGAQETGKMKKVRTISLKFICIIGVSTTILSVLGSSALVGQFTRLRTCGVGQSIVFHRPAFCWVQYLCEYVVHIVIQRKNFGYYFVFPHIYFLGRCNFDITDAVGHQRAMALRARVGMFGGSTVTIFLPKT